MGFFSKLFEKKVCDICGNEIGLFGNNKLADGNMCDDCHNKLSPFFDGTRQATLEEIHEQLAYREENKSLVEAFKVTRTLGKTEGKVLLDEDNGNFIVLKDDVRDWRSQNPDVIPFSKVTGCTVDVDEDENKREVMRRNVKGEEVSFNPPRYEYSWDYDVYVNIDVRHRYINTMRIKINEYSIKTTRQGRSAELDNCERIAEQIRRALLEVRREQREQKQEQATRQAITCPYCGATTIPDASGCCEYCGGSVM